MFPHHVFPETTEITPQGHLAIGGCDTLDLAQEYGTPVYVLDEVTLRNRCRAFVQEFQRLYSKTRVLYASKAYINPALARIFQEEGLGLDVVSGGELAVAHAAGFPLDKVYFHGNNKTPDELAQAVQQGIGRVVVDSFHELGLLDRIAGEAGKIQDILVRVSPGIDPHTHVYTTTGIIDSKFGFSIQTGDAARAVRQALSSANLRLRGLHFHLGSPIFELEPYRAATKLVLKFAADLREESDISPPWQDGAAGGWEFSPGGGFAIAYTRDQQPPAVAQYAETIVTALKTTCDDLGLGHPDLLVEPGRAIIGPAGVALYRIGAIKDITGVRKYVSVDGGMGDNIRPALYQAVYEVVSAGKADRQPTEKVTIAGKYCESGDVLATDIMLPQAEAGDIIAIPASGAYCPSMASNYNLNPRPPMVLVQNGRSRLIRRRESYQDLMLCDVN
jgi:diaminopimelate decarboxylase